VKWKGFADKDSTWEKNGDIGAELVDEFEASYKGNGGTLFPLPLKQREEKAGAAEAGGAGGHREGRMSWREDVPIWAEGVLYLEITSLLFWVKFEMGTAKPF
jgi:hypothetical protein